MGFFQDLWNGIVGAANTVWTTVTDVFTGNFSGAFNEVTNGLRDAISNMANFIFSVVNKVKVALEELRFHLSQDLSRLYNNNVGFWVIIVAAAASVAALPSVVAFALKEYSALGIKSWLKAQVANVSSWAGWQTVNAAIEVNRVAQILFQNYDSIWNGIYADVSQIALDIGYSASSIGNVVTAVKALITTGYSMAGASTSTAELTALSNMSDYLNGLSSNFDRYAQNPQLIWNDLWDKVILPHQKFVHDYFQKEADAIAILQYEMSQIEKLPGQFKTYQDSVQQLLGVQLSSTQAQIEHQVFAYVNKQLVY